MMDIEDFKKKINLLNKKPVAIIWFSCIDKKRSLKEIRKIWEINSPILNERIDKKDEETTPIKNLGNLGLIKADYDKPGRGAKSWAYSKLDWLAAFLYYLSREYQNSEIISEIRDIMPISEMSEREIQDVLECDAFRKACMKLEFLKEEFSWAKATYHIIEYLKKTHEPGIPLAKFSNFDLPLTCLNEIKLSDRKGGKSKTIDIEEIKKIAERGKKEAWKFSRKIPWEIVIVGHLQLLSLFKAFENDKKCFECWKADTLQSKKIYSLGQIPFEKIYNLIKEKKYKIPERIKPLFTIDEYKGDIVVSLKMIRYAWPYIWKEILEEMKLIERE